MKWIQLAYDRDQWRAVVNMEMNIWVPKIAKHFLTSWETISFSRKTRNHLINLRIMTQGNDQWAAGSFLEG
jgi:hypothetical protein